MDKNKSLYPLGQWLIIYFKKSVDTTFMELQLAFCSSSSKCPTLTCMLLEQQSITNRALV